MKLRRPLLGAMLVLLAASPSASAFGWFPDVWSVLDQYLRDRDNDRSNPPPTKVESNPNCPPPASKC